MNLQGVKTEPCRRCGSGKQVVNIDNFTKQISMKCACGSEVASPYKERINCVPMIAEKWNEENKKEQN